MNGGAGMSGVGGSGGSGGEGRCADGYVSDESCNGIDDDCDGEVDELGTFTCGVGACAQTVSACVNGSVSACLPLAPTTTTDDCNGIDDDCDGAVDEDCAGCFRVSTTGDDAAAIASGGSIPFASVQAAIDYADTHRSMVTRVCVAAGTACGMTATFSGPSGSDLTMRDGISVLGNYESTAWTRCTTSTTRLAPQTGSGVVFPANVSNQTVLDGFAIDRVAATTTAGVSVTGAQNVMLSNLTIVGSPVVDTSYGVNITEGGRATIFRSRIDSGDDTRVGIAVRAVDSQVAIEDNCSSAANATTGRCQSVCSASGPEIRSNWLGRVPPPVLPTEQYPIVLENSPGSRVERSSVCSLQSLYGQLAETGAILVRGDATGDVIRANSVRYDAPAYATGVRLGKFTLRFLACAGAVPWVVDNDSIRANSAADLQSVVEARGDCHPTIEANDVIEAIVTGDGATWAAVRCVEEAGVSSRCVVTNNPTIGGVMRPSPNTSPFSYGFRGTGVHCTGDSCARIDENSIVGVSGGGVAVPVLVGTGIEIHGPALIADNDITGATSGMNQKTVGVGIRAEPARGLIEHNVILGSGFPPSQMQISISGAPPVGLSIASTVDREWTVRSNTITAVSGAPCSTSVECGGGFGPFSAPSAGIEQLGTAGIFEDNIVSPGGCENGLAVTEGTVTERHPGVFLNNHLIANPRGGFQAMPGAYYRDGSAGYLLTAAEVDALTDMTASGTTVGCE